jgi:uncharacterized membrane protein YhaH (DUF805 family)
MVVFMIDFIINQSFIFSMHWFIDPIKYHYTDCEGRVGRQEFWMFTLFSNLLVMFGFLINDVAANLLLIVIFAPSIAITVRRLQDTGRSGWWLLLYMIPLIGWIVLIVWFSQKTDPSNNAYGTPAVPKSVTPETTTVAPATPVSDTTAAE